MKPTITKKTLPQGTHVASHTYKKLRGVVRMPSQRRLGPQTSTLFLSVHGFTFRLPLDKEGKWKRRADALYSMLLDMCIKHGCGIQWARTKGVEAKPRKYDGAYRVQMQMPEITKSGGLYTTFYACISTTFRPISAEAKQAATSLISQLAKCRRDSHADFASDLNRRLGLGSYDSMFNGWTVKAPDGSTRKES